MRFREELQFHSEAKAVWKRASSVRDMPLYWHGTKTLEVVGTEGQRLRAKVKFAFGGSGESEIAVDDGRRAVMIKYVSGPFTGTQSIVVKDGSIASEWDVRFKGALRLLSRWNERHFQSGTRRALERLISESGPEQTATLEPERTR